jgi:hypothetical protein
LIIFTQLIYLVVTRHPSPSLQWTILDDGAIAHRIVTVQEFKVQRLRVHGISEPMNGY